MDHRNRRERPTLIIEERTVRGSFIQEVQGRRTYAAARTLTTKHRLLPIADVRAEVLPPTLPPRRATAAARQGGQGFVYSSLSSERATPSLQIISLARVDASGVLDGERVPVRVVGRGLPVVRHAHAAHVLA